MYQNGQEYKGKVKGFLKQTVKALNVIASTNEGGNMLNELQTSKNNFDIKSFKANANKRDEFDATDVGAAFNNQLLTDPSATGTQRAKSGGSGGTIYWDPSGVEIPTTNGTQVNPAIDLAHEMFHALDANRGLLDDRLEQGIKRGEWQAVFRENTLRSQMGVPLRTHYVKSVDQSGNVLGGAGPRMITNSNTPILPSWYKP